MSEHLAKPVAVRSSPGGLVVVVRCIRTTALLH